MPAPRSPRCSLPALTLALALVALGACSSGSQAGVETPTGGCAQPIQERLDPDSLVHIFPGADEPVYTTDPPTSGPHAAAAATDGVRTEPLRRSEQVGLLEAGVVLVQYDGLTDAEQQAIQALADAELVLVAPNPDLPDPIVVTAWTRKLRCTSLGDEAVEAIVEFVEAHRGVSHGADG